MIKSLRLFFLVLFNLLPFFIIANSKVLISQKPAWVIQVKADFSAEPETSSVSGGFYLLLLDKQFDADSKSEFRHFAIKILNSEGIQSMSDISIDFDPVFQKLTFHKLNVIRKNKVINKLNDHEILTYQREADLERNLYDGRLTAVINLKDIRPGDIIEYEYTIIGNNPIYANHYTNSVQLQFTIPVRRSYFRLIVSKNANIRLAYPNGKIIPEINRTASNIEYIWDLEHLPPLLFDQNTPVWYNPLKSVEISDFKSWGEVVALMKELYELKDAELTKLKQEIPPQILSKNKDESITNAIRFVQDEIRYLGFESGFSAYKPHPSLQVLNQRFGDCKDKTMLLCAILQMQGVQAYPVLVSSLQAYNIEKSLPTISVFDHVVAQINYDGKTHYIDPTISNQGGRWDKVFFPYYRKGLVLINSGNALTDLPKPNNTKTIIIENFVFDEIGGSVIFSVKTEYYGADADIQRNNFNTSSLDFVEKTYLDYYSNLYPLISSIKTLTFDDNRNTDNVFTVEEKYLIEDCWEKSDDNPDLIFFNIVASNIEYEIGEPKSVNRTMPYYQKHPINIFQTTSIRLPESWNVETAQLSINSDEFVYESRTRYLSNTITTYHHYKTNSDFVSEKNFVDYRKKAEKVTDNLYFQVSYNKNLSNNSQISWFAIIVTFLSMAFGVFFALKIYKNYDPVAKNSVETFTRRIGGWLVLIAIGLSISPLVLIFQVYNTGTYFDAAIWSALITPDSGAFNLSLALLLLTELIYNSIYFVFTVLLVILFFKRRTSLPRLIVLYFVITLSFISIDSLLAYQINNVVFHGPEFRQLIRDLARVIISAAIWVPYFLFSERVKDTFTVRYLMTGEESEIR